MVHEYFSSVLAEEATVLFIFARKGKQKLDSGQKDIRESN